MRAPAFRLLSHPFDGQGPVWPGNPPNAEVQSVHAIANGDDANTTAIRLFSHSGTHVDAPLHFNPEGPAAHELPIDSFVFTSPRIVDVPKPDGDFITTADLAARSATLAAADLVLMRTGWGRMRDIEPQRYALEGPLLHPDAAELLMTEYPAVRAVAIDAISIGSPRHRVQSVRTHHILTGVGRDDGRFVLIYEDVRVDPDLPEPSRVYAWPLYVHGADGTPCTIVAELLR
jgi:kynurenine formamidase